MPVITRAEIISVKDLSEDIKEFIIKPEKYKRFDPGTFLQLALEDASASDYWPESRTFSIASYLNTDKTMCLIIKKKGEFTSRLFSDFKGGSLVTIKYAYGDFLLPTFDHTNQIICIAGGTGIAPFISFMEYLKANQSINRMELYYSCKKSCQFYKLDYIEKLLDQSKRKLFVTRENDSPYLNKRMTIEDIRLDDKAHYYICGSKEFISCFKQELLMKNINNIYLDEWE